jgi:hypothetical protein
MYSQVPDWAFFQHINISADDQRAQEGVEQAAADALEGLLAGSDEITISQKHGIQTISATTDLMKEQPAARKKQRWWQKIYR